MFKARCLSDVCRADPDMSANLHMLLFNTCTPPGRPPVPAVAILMPVKPRSLPKRLQLRGLGTKAGRMRRSRAHQPVQRHSINTCGLLHSAL